MYQIVQFEPQPPQTDSNNTQPPTEHDFGDFTSGATQWPDFPPPFLTTPHPQPRKRKKLKRREKLGFERMRERDTPCSALALLRTSQCCPAFLHRSPRTHSEAPVHGRQGPAASIPQGRLKAPKQHDECSGDQSISNLRTTLQQHPDECSGRFPQSTPSHSLR